MPSPPGEHCVSFGKSARLSLSLSPLTSVLARRLGIRPPLPSHSEVQVCGAVVRQEQAWRERRLL